MKNAFYIAVSSGYELGFHALINSILIHNHNEEDIIILYKNDCITYINWLKTKLNDLQILNKFIFIEAPMTSILARYRFDLLSDLILLKSYDTIWMVDADMFLTSNWNSLFKISNNTDLLVGVRDYTDRRYDENYFHCEYGKKLFKDKKIYQEEFLCTVPFFFNKQNSSIINIHCELQKNIPELSDMDILNLAICLENKMNLVHALPADIFTEVHFTFMSPFTRISINKKESDYVYKETDKTNFYVRGNHHQKYYSIHGKFWTKSWTNGMRKYFADHLRVSYNVETEPTKSILQKKADEAMDGAIKIFKYYLNGFIPMDMTTIKKLDDLNV